MFGRIKDAVRTLTQGGVSDAEARHLRMAAECRQLIQEMHSVLESATILAAREAKRNARAAKRREEEVEELNRATGFTPPAPDQDWLNSDIAPVDRERRAQWKAHRLNRRTS